MKILIVDDEKELVETLTERLELRGFGARGATTGPEALKILSREPFDVVLLDVKMPGMGGLQVLETIKERWPAQKVVLLTGHGSRHNAAEGMRLGADECLMKPVKIGDLISTLEGCAGQGESHDQ
jgi:DNA-binding response OmpR family regulator